MLLPVYVSSIEKMFLMGANRGRIRAPFSEGRSTLGNNLIKNITTQKVLEIVLKATRFSSIACQTFSVLKNLSFLKPFFRFQSSAILDFIKYPRCIILRRLVCIPLCWWPSVSSRWTAAWPKGPVIRGPVEDSTTAEDPNPSIALGFNRGIYWPVVVWSIRSGRTEPTRFRPGHLPVQRHGLRLCHPCGYGIGWQRLGEKCRWLCDRIWR